MDENQNIETTKEHASEQTEASFFEEIENLPEKEEEKEDKKEPLFTLDDIELEHISVLAEMASMCRTDSSGFTETDRLDRIEKLVTEKGPYQKIYAGNHTVLYATKPLEELEDKVILVSSHVDTVRSIPQVYSEYDSTTGFLHGTYDNLSTNAAMVNMMRDEDIPECVVFAFNGDEETGRCKGAKEATKVLKEVGKKPVLCIALDVTYEGYYENALYSVENISIPLIQQENFLINRLLEIEPEGEKTFSVTPKDRKSKLNALPKEYFSGSYGMFDEACAYAKKGFSSCSICIPCKGDMHGPSGLKIKQPVFEGYQLSLTSLLWSLTKTHENLIDAYKIARNTCLERAKQIKVQQYSYTTSTNTALWDYETPTYSYSYEQDHLVFHKPSSPYNTQEEFELNSETSIYLTMEKYDELFELACTYEAEDLEYFIEDLHYDATLELSEDDLNFIGEIIFSDAHAPVQDLYGDDFLEFEDFDD